jgi:amino acid transporter
MNSLFRKKSIDKILSDAQSGYGDAEHIPMHKVLGVRDLTFFGIAAIIGAGIFSSIGKACFDGGPGVIFLYIFTAVACGFAALCYAEFASTVPVSGSAYTYAYVAYGELFAWIIGWDLLMEYAIGNIAVAISWSDYFTNLMDKAGLHMPAWLTMDYVTSHAGYNEVSALLAKGQSLTSMDVNLVEKYDAWLHAPMLGSLHLIMDLPAFCIVALITAVVFVGIKESRAMSNIMVIIKLAVIFLIIVLGAYYVNPDNWSPFTPNGFSGILKGVSAVFFAYIGFDAISTTAEECKDPQKDLPRGMIYALVICTILYVVLALILTGMVSYTQLNVGDPLALIFEARGLKWIAGIVSFSAIIATASVLLIFQMGQPRIWMSMSRDGLLPKIFSRMHPKYRTPSFSTILTGVLVAIPALFLSLDFVISITSIGTLFAFVLVCGGILVLDQMPNKPNSKFKVPYVSGKYIVPALFLLAIVLTLIFAPAYFIHLFSLEGIPMLFFWIILTVVTYFSFRRNFSLIPVLGLVSCFYLMAQETNMIWIRFIAWLLIGLVIYFLYSRKNSKLASPKMPI